MKHHTYYLVKSMIPRRVQLLMRRNIVRHKKKLVKHIWPIDEISKKKPANWPGWPQRKKFALVLTHDVDTAKGVAKCRDLMNLERNLGFRSSFNFVPKRYQNCPKLRAELTDNGFEVGVHGLKHDGKLYKSRKIFLRRASQINHYIKEWQAVGFRSPSMHHKLDWIHDLNIEYDASTFDTDPFEPQPDGARTIFPFWVENGSPTSGYVELPYTLAQDFTLFVLMKEKNINIWKRKIDWIVKHEGMILMNIHPDYMNFGKDRNKLEKYPARYYQQCLEYIEKKYHGQYWHALPKEVARYLSNTKGAYSAAQRLQPS